MQIKSVNYTSDTSRKVKVGTTHVRLLHTPLKKLQHADAVVGLSLCPLLYVPSCTKAKNIVIASIKSKIATSEFKELFNCKVPFKRSVPRQFYTANIL
jgi:hypothetical protein